MNQDAVLYVKWMPGKRCTSRLAEAADVPRVNTVLEHVSFGSVQRADRRPIKNAGRRRIGLRYLDEAVDRGVQAYIKRRRTRSVAKACPTSTEGAVKSPAVGLGRVCRAVPKPNIGLYI